MNTLKSAIIYILSGSLLIEFHAITDNIPSTIIALFGCYIFYLGCQKMLIRGDHQWNKGVNYLTTSLYVLIISILVDIIPLLGFMATFGYIVSFIIQVYSILQMCKSKFAVHEVRNGLNFVIIGLGFAAMASFVNLIPFLGGYISAYFATIYFIFITLGWLRVIDNTALENQTA